MQTKADSIFHLQNKHTGSSSISPVSCGTHAASHTCSWSAGERRHTKVPTSFATFDAKSPLSAQCVTFFFFKYKNKSWMFASKSFYIEQTMFYSGEFSQIFTSILRFFKHFLSIALTLAIFFNFKNHQINNFNLTHFKKKWRSEKQLIVTWMLHMRRAWPSGSIWTAGRPHGRQSRTGRLLVSVWTFIVGETARFPIWVCSTSSAASS
jgi:hypothetical protein